MARCGWRVHEGYRYYHPECWGGLYDIGGCYCQRDKRGTEQRISDLEEELKQLKDAVTALKA